MTRVTLRQTPTPHAQGAMYEARDPNGRACASFKGLTLSQVIAFLRQSGDRVTLDASSGTATPVR